MKKAKLHETSKEQACESISDSKLLLEIEKRLDPSLVSKFRDAKDELSN